MRNRTLGRLALTITFAVGALLVAFPATALAAGTFVGGPDVYPVYVANDHTPIAVHYSVEASLAPNTVYFLKVRFTPGLVPGGILNRGYTWNPETRQWAQERDLAGWSIFPTVTTDAQGKIGGAAGWAFVAFGNEDSTGTYHLMISLSATGKNGTFNGSFAPTVTVLAPHIGGAWVHNGLGTGAAAAEALVTDEASSAVLAVARTETQGVDDDMNGIVDDEDYGPLGSVGDFRASVPALTAIRVLLGGTPWAPSEGFVTGPADTDLAIGVVDHVAPSAPGTLNVSSGDATASISWPAATDDTGVTGYHVYRWSPLDAGTTWGYTPPHQLVATVPIGVTTYHDTGLTDGLVYFYEVRAFDAATNVGPRSLTGIATPVAAVPVASVDPADPDGSAGWYVHEPTVTLTPSSPQFVVQYAFEATPPQWTTYTEPIPIQDGDKVLYFRQTDGVTASATQQLRIKVDVDGPAASFVGLPTYWVQAGTHLTFPVTWKGLDAVGSGVDTTTFDVQYRDGSTGATRTLSFTSHTSTTFAGTKGHTYYFQVRAQDIAGNQGDWSAWSAGTVVPYDQTTAKYSSHWSTVKHSSAYIGSVKYTTHNGAYANFTLSKGTLYLVATTGPKNGKVKITYRGKTVATISTYSRTTKYRQLFKIATYLKGAKPSSVKLVAQTKHSRPHVQIDGFALRW